MTETVPVRGGSMPVPLYLHLLPTAERLGVSVFDLLVELARRELAKPQPEARATGMTFEERLARNPRAHRTWAPEHTAPLRELHAEGRTDAEIAERLGFTTPTIARRRTNAMLTRNEPRKAVQAA